MKKLSSKMPVTMSQHILSSSLPFYLLFLVLSFNLCSAANVTYDSRSLIIDGQRKLLISASIHYPRSVPGMWPELVQTAKEGGVDVIETYVFWNGHETAPSQYHFEGRYDLVKFVKIVQQAGMYLILRIGPYIAAEWNFGGIPVWLHYVPGTVFRTDNYNFKYYMQRFLTYTVNLMKQENLFASQGGPIILAQVENEYGFFENAYGAGGKRYAMWAAQMAVSQNIGVPWIMCQQFDAPPTVINTCNSFYCDDFKPIYPDKPKFWTENWPGWHDDVDPINAILLRPFERMFYKLISADLGWCIPIEGPNLVQYTVFKRFGDPNPHRPPEDIAFSVARFFQKGGSLQNYYMYHGGTNFGRTSGGPFITTSYDYDAPIDEYGLPRLPKWGHLKGLHRAIHLCEHALLNSEPTSISLGPSLEAYVYDDASGACAAFLSNSDDKNDKTVIFRNVSYHLPAWSVSILPDCKKVVFNTAKVSSQSSVVEMLPEALQPSVTSSVSGKEAFKWEVYTENAGIWGEVDFVNNELVDHINTTQDTTDYLWYTTSILVGGDEEFLKNGTQPVLFIDSKGHALHVFVNQQLQGSASGNGTHSPYKFKKPIPLKAGKNEIALLSMTVGLQNGGLRYEWWGAGLTSVKIKGFNNGTVDLSSNDWYYKIGLQGEKLGIFTPDGVNKVKWVAAAEPPKNQPLTWYKAIVDVPSGDEPVGLDMLHMGKGLAWLNGEEIGRYWPRKSPVNGKCVKECDYRGKFNPDKCSTGCGEPTQQWYHVPRSWFKPSGNILVIFEEKGGDPTRVQFVKRQVSNVCSVVAEDHPFVDQSLPESENLSSNRKPSVHLKCPAHKHISTVKFASFGTPTGTCGSFSVGHCHDANSISVVEKVCLNKNECAVELTEDNFRKSLCSGKIRKLAIEVVCN